MTCQVCAREKLDRLQDVLDDTSLAFIGAICPTGLLLSYLGSLSLTTLSLIDPFNFEEVLRQAAGETMKGTELEDFVKIKSAQFSRDFLTPCLLSSQGRPARYVYILITICIWPDSVVLQQDSVCFSSFQRICLAPAIPLQGQTSA
jgi:hypothetical protein